MAKETHEVVNLRDRQLRAHFNQFIDRDCKYPGCVLTDETWSAFKKRETYGAKSLTDHERSLIEPLFDAKKNYEITIQTLWEEMSEYWANGWGWDIPLRATISDVWNGRSYDKEGHPVRMWANRVYLNALFKIRRAIKQSGFVEALMAYTGLSYEEKCRYLRQWELTNFP